jgi:hypothetical protein
MKLRKSRVHLLVQLKGEEKRGLARMNGKRSVERKREESRRKESAENVSLPDNTAWSKLRHL